MKIGEIDKKAWNKGIVLVGVDEVGRGPLAGPVAAGAVLMEADLGIEGINDSKKLSEKKRETLAKEINEACLTSVVYVSHEEIDEIGIKPATFKSMRGAVENVLRDTGLLRAEIEKNVWVLVDGPEEIPNSWFRQKAVIRGDGASLVIAAAFIVAKVARDALMVEYDKQYPDFGFAKHKGYGTQEHLRALEEHGPCPIHRMSVRSVRKKETREAYKKAKSEGAPWYVLQKLGRYE